MLLYFSLSRVPSSALWRPNGRSIIQYTQILPSSRTKIHLNLQAAQHALHSTKKSKNRQIWRKSRTCLDANQCCYTCTASVPDR
jgi:hypothetical protein